MKILLLFASLFFISPSYQEQESPELKEATELSASVVQLFNQQKFDEALQLAKRALQISEKLNLAATVDSLAVIYYRQGNMSKAESMYQRAALFK